MPDSDAPVPDQSPDPSSRSGDDLGIGEGTATSVDDKLAEARLESDTAEVLDDESAALGLFTRIHPLGVVCVGVLIVAALWHTVFSTERLIGNLAWWQWAALILMVVLSVIPALLNGLRLGIEALAEVTKQIVWVLAWVVFFVQLFNVITRYANPLFDADILIGQMTSVAWQTFAAISLLGLNYGVKAAVNPRVDFWWAEWSQKRKAWLDFIMHVFFFLPFLYMSTQILQGYASTSLGQKRDGTWPNGWRVWETWEQSGDADQLPVGGIKAVLFVGFVLFALQILAEVIKVGFVLAGRREYAAIARGDEFQRIE